jgi:hypothetical protein
MRAVNLIDGEVQADENNSDADDRVDGIFARNRT